MRREDIPPTATPRTPGALRAAGLLLLSQLIFWSALIVAELAARPDGLTMARFVDVYRGDEAGRIVPGTDPTRVPLHPEPGYIHREPYESERAVFVHDFTTTDVSVDKALYVAWMRRVIDVRVNDRQLTTSNATDLWGIMGGFEPVIYSIPADYLVEGGNRLSITVSGRVSHVLPVFFIGDPASLSRAHMWGRIFSIDLVIAATGVLLFVLLLTLSIHWPAEDRARVRALSLLLGAWALRNLTVLDIDSWIPNPWRLFSHFVVTFTFLLALVVFAAGWTGASRLWYRGSAIVLAVATLISLTALHIGTLALFRTAFYIETTLTLGIGLIVTTLLLRHYARGQRHERAETLLFLICTTVVVVDAVDDRFAITVPFLSDIPLTFYAAPMCGLLLALGMAASLAAQSTRARRVVMTINETLERRLAEREREIEASYARQAEYERQKTIADERQRMVRDMHDGMGGQLVSLMMRARNGSIEREELAEALQGTLDDLRLVVHSMNNVGDSLDTALGTFRARIEPQIEAAGLALDWFMDVDGPVSGFGPHSVLNVYRILQEACTNAMRHSGGDRLAIRVERDAGKGEIRIAVRDNGQGPRATTRPNGHGTRNMLARARRLGGTLEVLPGPDGSGTEVLLTMPLRDNNNRNLSAAS